MAVRKNIAKSKRVAKDFVRGCLLLKQEVTSPNGLSTWDTFVVWHHRAMMTMTPAGTDRNAAHGGPVFLPWHRYMLVLLERNLQRVLQDPDFGLPYWDWAADGQKTPAQQRAAKLWSIVGGSGTPVATGPFRAQDWRVRVELDPSSGQLVYVDRGLNRDLGAGAARLPNRAAVRGALLEAVYDTNPWSRTSAASFRNHVEGWSPSPPALHNLVHVWVGGDMLASTSPNDPVFYLNHCNVDRLWSAWQDDYGVNSYRPAQNDATAPQRHRPDDLLYPLQMQAPRVKQMFDVASVYTYA